MDENSKQGDLRLEKITRKEAMKKAGKYTVFTASSMLFFFSPKKVQASSVAPEALDSGQGEFW